MFSNTVGLASNDEAVKLIKNVKLILSYLFHGKYIPNNCNILFVKNLIHDLPLIVRT